MKYGLPDKSFPRGVWVLLLSIAVIHVAAYIIVPILPIILRSDKGLTTAQVGIVIGSTSLSLQLGSIVAGFLSDRVGRRSTLAIGSLILASSLLGLGLSQGIYSLIFFALLNGTGSGIYAPTAKAAISALVSTDNQTTAFSLRGIAANVGTSLAGLLVILLAPWPSTVLFVISTSIYASLAVLSWITLPSGCEGEPCPQVPVSDYINIFRNRRFVLFSIASFLIWMVFAQFGLAIPLRGEEILDNSRLVALVWTIMSINVIVFQTLINRLVLNRISSFMSLGIGTLFIAIAIALIGWADSFAVLVVIAIVFSLGEMLFMPTMDSITGNLASPELLAAYFSIANLSAGLGSATGNYIGGRLLQYYGIVGSITPWIMYIFFGLFTSVIVIAFGRIIEKKPNIH